MNDRLMQMRRVAILIDEVSWSPRTRFLLIPLEEYRDALRVNRVRTEGIPQAIQDLIPFAESGEGRIGRHLQKAIVDIIRNHLHIEHARHGGSNPVQGCPFCQREAKAVAKD